jgi:hypothetical protein
MHGLKAITDIWKGTAYDNAHGVIKIGLFHLVFEINGDNFFSEV